ncbi:hypothetical protein ONE63_009573 [Megalurothrips usitatus]|uniref:BEN domain-containing protein n=1 Tax=Megalurothrips usitatus TaxID=439358 RepID=A0AAV7XRL9_9NEOP|nr:hypothetical protein ONE63_009573 [Megalurothrips usitatus]
MEALVFWPETKQISIEDLDVIREEDRYEGAPTTIKFGNRAFKAVVRLISDDRKRLKEKEDEVQAEIDVMIEEEKKLLEPGPQEKGGRRLRDNRKVAANEGAATANQVASAVGERMKPNPQQAVAAKRLAAEKKAAEAAQRTAQDAVDKAAISKGKVGDKATDKARGKVTNKASNRTCGNSAEDTQRSAQVFDFQDAIDKVGVGGSEKKGGKAPDKADKAGSSGSCFATGGTQIAAMRNLFQEEDEQNEEGDSDDGVLSVNSLSDDEPAKLVSSTAGCCCHCLELRKAFDRSPQVFLKAVAAFGNATVTGVQWLDLLPIPDNAPKCELSKGSKVFISIADKDGIKCSGNGDPSKMARATLMVLFGRENFEKHHVTALGTRLGTKGVQPHVRAAVKNFVNRHVKAPFRVISEVELNKLINKKKQQIHRKSPSGKSKSKPLSPSKSSSPAKSSTQSPAKSST